MPIYFTDHNGQLSESALGDGLEGHLGEMLKALDSSIKRSRSQLAQQASSLKHYGERIEKNLEGRRSDLSFCEIQGNTWRVDPLIAELKVMTEVRDHIQRILDAEQSASAEPEPVKTEGGAFGKPLPKKKKHKAR